MKNIQVRNYSRMYNSMQVWSYIDMHTPNNIHILSYTDMHQLNGIQVRSYTGMHQ
jgi:hypothetical protein